mgnify:CR=1 FL=1
MIEESFDVEPTDNPTAPLYIYALIDPDTGDVRYAGKCRFPTYRMRSHVVRCSNWYQENSDKGAWIRDLLSRGKQPIVRILERVTENNCVEKEAHWIRFFRNAGNSLTNQRPVAGSKFASGTAKNVNFLLTADLYNRLKTAADEDAVSIGQFLRNLVNERLTERESSNV